MVGRCESKYRYTFMRPGMHSVVYPWPVPNHARVLQVDCQPPSSSPNLQPVSDHHVSHIRPQSYYLLIPQPHACRSYISHLVPASMTAVLCSRCLLPCIPHCHLLAPPNASSASHRGLLGSTITNGRARIARLDPQRIPKATIRYS